MKLGSHSFPKLGWESKTNFLSSLPPAALTVYQNIVIPFVAVTSSICQLQKWEHRAAVIHHPGHDIFGLCSANIYIHTRNRGPAHCDDLHCVIILQLYYCFPDSLLLECFKNKAGINKVAIIIQYSIKFCYTHS